MRRITVSHYENATGVWPVDDDLERCNCERVGQIGHSMCGWNWHRNLPNFWPEKIGLSPPSNMVDGLAKAVQGPPETLDPLHSRPMSPADKTPIENKGRSQ